MIKNIPCRIYSQYRSKPKAVAWYDIARKLGGDIEAAAQAVRMSYDINTAKGEQLDVIGRIAVIDRGFISNIDLWQHSFSTDDYASQFGDEDVMFSERTAASDTQMSDEIFRIAIKAKINKNVGDATIHSILDQCNNLIPNMDYVALVNDTGDMSFSIEFSGDVNNVLRWSLFNEDLIQRPSGVNFKGFKEILDVHQFGDEDAAFNDYEDDTMFGKMHIEA